MVPSHLVLGGLYFRVTSNHRRTVPAPPTCLVHHSSTVWSILSPRYQPQSSATLYFICQLCHPVCRGSTKTALLLEPNSEPVGECASRANLSLSL
ncbi:hypothetical protein PBY51_022817 [Eleginops maclovinus]|uniref:Uncharacterized protein n=1 Tax=Eleginops maclovinus TaxID=56733 RepID=A0AAN8AIP5_ELEMC|nr:hypothetical protein PBY51_022817 [Eleginops maclovinus]